MTKAVTNFINKLVVYFGEPKFDVEEASKTWAHREWLREMILNLADFPDDVLEQAASIIASTRKHRNFPLISECKAACYDARRKIAEAKPALPLDAAQKAQSFSAERQQLAKDLIQGEMGITAAKEGWIWSLYQHCLRHACLPTDNRKIQGMKDAARLMSKDVEGAARGEFGPFSKDIMDLGQSLLKKRDALRDYVLHGVVP